MDSSITEAVESSRRVKAQSAFVTVYVGIPLALHMDLSAQRLGITRSKLGKILIERGLEELEAELV